MKYVLHIVWKDMRALWWELSAAVVVTLGMAGLQFAPGTGPMQTLREVSPVLAVLAWVLLVVQLVQSDALVGTEHDWRTRPIRRRDLVLAKVLFVVAFLGVPMVVGDVIVLMGNGFAPLNYVPGMLGKLVWLTVVILLPAAALGAITRTVPQALLAALGTAIVVGVSLAAVSSGKSSWGGADWVRGSWLSVSGSAVAVGVLWLQFGRHRTIAARATAVGGTALAVLTAYLMPWAVGFGVQKLAASKTVGGVNVVPLVGEKPSAKLMPRLPVSIVDLPDGHRAQLIRGRVTIDVDGERVVRDAMAGDEYLVVAPAGHTESPARINGRVWLAILARQSQAEFDAKEEYVRAAGLGACKLGSDGGPAGRFWLASYCRTPYRAPATGYLILKTGGGTDREEQFNMARSYSPWPSQLILTPLVEMPANIRGLDSGTPPAGSRVTLETWAPVAYVERTFAADVKRLGDFVGKDVGR